MGFYVYIFERYYALGVHRTEFFPTKEKAVEFAKTQNGRTVVVSAEAELVHSEKPDTYLDKDLRTPYGQSAEMAEAL